MLSKIQNYLRNLFISKSIVKPAIGTGKKEQAILKFKDKYGENAAKRLKEEMCNVLYGHSEHSGSDFSNEK